VVEGNGLENRRAGNGTVGSNPTLSANQIIQRTRNLKLNWVLLSFVSLISLSMMSFLITTLTRKGYPTSFILLSVGIIFTICYSLQTFGLMKYRPELRLETLALLALIGLLSVIGNLALFQAARDAPNAGLALAIGGMQSAGVAVLALIFLKDRLSILQAAGLLLGIVAVTLMAIGDHQPTAKHSGRSTNDQLTLKH
jgi:drug/metabolite transporter (DMT)-like permease